MAASRKALPLALLALLAACNNVNGALDLATADSPDAQVPEAGNGPGPNVRLDGGSQPNVGVTVSAPEGLELGEMVCGATSAPRPLVIENHTKSDVTFETWLGAGTAFLVSPPTGVVPAGKTLALGVTASIPPLGPVGDRAEVVSVTTNVPGDAPHELEVGVRVVGTLFKIEPADKIDFGTTKSASRTITLRNEGNIPGTLDLRPTQYPFSLEPNGSIPLDANGTSTRVVRVNVGNGASTIVGELAPSTSSLHCGPLPVLRLSVKQVKNH